ncbi:MAG: hypothetical protein HZB47_06450 [Nitrosomonadales bacterium]|nr:hypothetical protein [Nitrosomonadales bacterium]
MKKLGMVLLLGWSFAILPMNVWGEGWSLGGADWGRLTLGVVSGIAAHEVGHMVVAKSKGYRVSHDGLSITYPGVDFTRSGQLQLASAGYQTQWVLSELVLRDNNWQERKTPPSDFGAGIVISSVGVSAAYLTILKHQLNGDVYGVSRASGMSHDRAALLMAIPAALDAWRLFGDDVPEWVPNLAVASKGVEMAWIWAY